MIEAPKGEIPIDIVEEIVTLGEGYKTEFKETLPSEQSLAKSLCAFTNAKGGNLFIGINDSGAATGITDMESELAVIEKAIPLIIPKPDIIVQTFSFKKKEILYIEIKEGTNKPYYVKEGETTQSYIRAADVNLPASKKVLRTFINGSSRKKGHEKAIKRDEKVAYDLFDQNKRLSISQIREILNYSERRIKKILVTLTRQGMIVPSYNEKNVYYRTEDR
ncbi:MAG: ATP-binding protein [Spirochaetota bacterium]|nr:MAG: ATP-binding protein [Spirochaetota bacterium]